MVIGGLAAASVAFVGRMVHVGSLAGGWVLHEVVTMVLETVLENTLVVRVRVIVDVE